MINSIGVYWKYCTPTSNLPLKSPVLQSVLTDSLSFEPTPTGDRCALDGLNNCCYFTIRIICTKRRYSLDEKNEKILISALTKQILNFVYDSINF